MQSDIRQLFNEFIKEREFTSRLSSRTVIAYKSSFRVFSTLMPEIEEPSFLNTQMITEFFKRLQERERQIGKSQVKSGVRDATVRSYWIKLKTFCEWLRQQGTITGNPFSGMRTPSLRQSAPRAILQDDVRKLYAAVALHSQSTFVLRRDTVMLSLFLFCGLRRNEFLSLEIRDLDMERHLLTIRSETSKSGRTRCIPIHPTLLFHLRDYLRERNKKGYRTQFLIAGSQADSGLTLEGIRHWVKRMQQKSRVKFHLHQFRHAFACNLAREDVHAVKIQKLLGHASLDMTMTYLQSIATEDLKKDICKLSL